jgi:hypothetical protein
MLKKCNELFEISPVNFAVKFYLFNVQTYFYLHNLLVTIFSDVNFKQKKEAENKLN